MTWRTVNWILWGALLVLVILGTLRVVGQQFAWVAFVVAGLAELVSLLQPATDPQSRGSPIELTPEMVRTQDRGYGRALRFLRSGGRVTYLEHELQLQGETVAWRTRPSQSLQQDERIALGELDRSGREFESLRRAAAEIDALCREKTVRLILLDPKRKDPSVLCTLENGTFRWAIRPANQGRIK